MRLFIKKCLLISAAACAILLLLNIRYQHVMRYRYVDQRVFDSLGTDYTNVMVSDIGSSHTAYGISYDSLRARGYSCFNFALPSQTYDYDLAVLHQFGKYLGKGGIMLIPVSYFSFNNEVTTDAEKRDMQTRYYYLLSPQNIPDYSLYTDIVTHRIPILSSGDEFWKIFPSLSINASAEGPASAPDPSVYQEKALARYERHFDGKTVLIMPERVQNLKDIIAYDQERGITPVLITTPYTSYYYDLVNKNTGFMTEFQDTITSVCKETGVNYYDYSHDTRICSDLNYFADGDHLNPAGALYFTGLMEQDIPEFRAFIAAHPAKTD